jgi:hypothetical protein
MTTLLFHLARLALPVADIGSSVTSVANYIIGLLAAISLFSLVIAGYHYQTAGDDIQAKARAKGAIGGSIVGMIIVGGAATTLNLVLPNIN